MNNKSTKSSNRKRGNTSNLIVKDQKKKSFYTPNLRTTLLCRDVGGFPDSYGCRLRYSASAGSAGTGSSVNAIATYYLNAPGSLSHTPKGWDVLKEVYDEYFVKSVSYRVTATNTSTTNPLKMYIVPINSDYTATLTSSINDLAETDGIYTRQLGVAAGGHDVAIANIPYTSVAALAGLNKEVAQENDDFTAYTGSPNSVNSYSVPINLYQLAIAWSSMSGTNIALNSIVFSVEIDMDVVFYSKLPIY